MSGPGASPPPALLAAAREAMGGAYAPYSRYPVGAALLFDDGAIVTGANVENASFGLTLCAETVAVATAMAQGRRGGLVEAVVVAAAAGRVTPCGRCRQVLHELARLGGTDPLIWCMDAGDARGIRLGELLPAAFGD